LVGWLFVKSQLENLHREVKQAFSFVAADLLDAEVLLYFTDFLKEIGVIPLQVTDPDQFTIQKRAKYVC
jgi:hypothetical protein